MNPASAALELGTTRERKFWPQDLVLGLLPLLIGFEILLWTIYLPLGLQGIADFRQLYTGGYMVRTGQAANLYDYDIQQKTEESLVPLRAHFLLPVNHPAFEELLFAPLSFLPYRSAFWIFMLLNIALTGLSLHLLRHRIQALSDRWTWFPPLLFAAFFPISRTLTQGQDSVIMLALLAGALLLFDRHDELGAGLLVGLGVFKFQIAIPVALLFLIWRRWRFSIGFAISSGLAALISAWMVGIHGVKMYLATMLSMSVRLSSEADVLRYATDPREMQNVRGLISGLLGGTLPHSWLQILIFAISAMILLVAGRQRPSLPLAITASSLVSYHLIAHDATPMIIPIAGALGGESVLAAIIALLFLIATITGLNPAYGYLASIPLLALFVLSVISRNEGTYACEKPGN